ncbi:MAG TPA: hypothetical protein VL498_06880 [Terracidiphilus sp.]|jgi:hypothetical protein|nr:hypothetical protein [Terracidiphilus sp.]
MNALDVLKRMGEEDLKIELSTDVRQVQKVKSGTRFSVETNGDQVGAFLTGTTGALLIVFDKKQYNELLARMEKELG